MGIGPFTTYAPPGVYTQTISEAVVNQLIGGLRVPVLIGVAQETLTQTNFEIIRGSSSVADTPIFHEDETGRFVVSGPNNNPVLGAANGVITKFKVRNYPIVSGAGTGSVTYNPQAVSVTVNGAQAVVSSVDGPNGIIQLLIPPQSTDHVSCNYYFHRKDTRITDDVSAQVTVTPAVLVAPKAEFYNIILGINDTLSLTVNDVTITNIKLTPGPVRAASDVANDINVAAVPGLTASVHVDNQGLNHVQLIAQGNILIGTGTANGTLGFNPGATTGRNKSFRVFNGPIVDGSDGGITTTDPSKVVVIVNGTQVLASAVNGQNQTVTLPFAPNPGSVVAITYYFNTWQDTFDYLPNSNITSVGNVGIAPGRNDYLNGPDFIVVNQGDQSIIQWGTAFQVTAGQQTGLIPFDSTEITGLLIDNRIFNVPCARFTDPTTNQVSTVKFVMPITPTTGNGRDTPLGISLYQTITNGRIDLPTNRPDLVTVLVGKNLRDALAHPPVQVLSVDSASNTFVLQNPVPADYQAFATFWYNRIQDDTFTFNVTVPGPSGVGQYQISSQLTGALVYGARFGTKSGLSETIQWPSGVENVPDAILTGSGHPVPETVTVTFNNSLDPATHASFSNANQEPYDLYTFSRLFGGVVIDGNAPVQVDLSLAYKAFLIGQPVNTPLVFQTSDVLILKIDGVQIAPISMSGLTTMNQVVTAINAAVDADTQVHADGSSTFFLTAPNNLASATAYGVQTILQVKGRNLVSFTNGLVSSVAVVTPVLGGQTDGSGVVGLAPNNISTGSYSALNQPAILVGTQPAAYNITPGVNDNLQLTVDGSDIGVTLPSGPAVTLIDVVTAINDAYLSVASPADIAQYTADVIALANDIRTRYNTHIAVAAYHLNADLVNTEPLIPAVDLPTAITLLNDLKVRYNAHRTYATAPGVVVGAANNGAGLIRLNVVAHGYVTGQNIVVAGVLGTTEANGTWTVTNFDANHFDLNNSVFQNAWAPGGTQTTTFEVHALADTVNVETAPNATNLQTAITLAHDLQVKFNAHLLQMGVHGHDDFTNVESLPDQVGTGITGTTSVLATSTTITTTAPHGLAAGTTVFFSTATLDPTISGKAFVTIAGTVGSTIVVNNTAATGAAFGAGGIVQDALTIQNLLNNQKAQINAHFASGSLTGIHLVADAVNTIVVANANDTANFGNANGDGTSAGPFTTQQALANAIKGALNNHFVQGGIHVVNDTTNTIATANATTQFSTIVPLAVAFGYNSVFGSFNVHRKQAQGAFNVHGTNDLVDASTAALSQLVAHVGQGINNNLLVLTSRVNTVVSGLTVKTASTATTVLGFVPGISASRTQPTAAAIATALNNNAPFAALAVAYSIAAPGLGKFLEINSRSAGSTSTISFTNIANSAFIPDAGLGIVPGTSGAIGDPAQAGYTVSSSAGSAGSHGTGFPGQTYTDATTGLRFTVLKASAGDYDNGGSFTLVVSTTFTCDAAIPIRAVGGVEVLVFNTLNMNPGTTALLNTYQHKGAEPKVGDVYYVSYNYAKTDLSTQLFRDLKTIQAAYGTPTPDNPLSLGAYLALLNGAVIVGLKQVLRAPNSSQATVGAYTAAIDEQRKPISGNIKQDVITPLATDPQIFSYLNQHCVFMSAPRQEGERTGIIGTAVGTTPLGVSAIAKGLASELMVVVYPDSFVISVTDANGNTVVQLVDGSFCAAALAGSTCNPSIDVASPFTRRQILGFQSLGRILDPTDANQVAVSGVTVIEQVESGMRVRHGLTTRIDTVITRTPSVTLTIQFVQQTLRRVLDPFIGQKFTGAVLKAVESQTVGTFGQLIDQAIVASVAAINVNTDQNDPTIMRLEAVYVPVFPLEYIVATMQIRVSM